MYFASGKDMNFGRIEGGMSWIELYPPPRSYIEALNSNVTIFGGGVFIEVVNIKQS